jgi:hypothetical protein
MMPDRRHPRINMSLDNGRLATHAPSSFTERLLNGLGANPSFSDAVLGDLAEERARRTADGSTVAAYWWYAREALRSIPHLLWNAVRHGGSRGRMKAAAVLATVACVPAIATLALLLRNGPPARLVIDSRYVTDGFIVNSVGPVRMSMKVLDSAGHALGSTGVRFGWISGTPEAVTANGVITCKQAGDATVRASLGEVTTSVLVHCRPLHDVRTPAMINLVAGDPPLDIPFEAVGMDGRDVTLLAGRINVGDTTIVSLEGQRMRPRAAGSTGVTVSFGDRGAFMSIEVYERAHSLEEILPGQHLAIPVTLLDGEMHRWRLPASRENYFVMILPDTAGHQTPALAIAGANCIRAIDGHSFYCLALHDASVIAYHSRQSDPGQKLSGMLAVWRQSWR